MIETDPVTGGPAPYDPDPDANAAGSGRWRVSFEYDFEPGDVTDEAEAAIRAFNMITDPASMAPIATVTRPDGTVVEHDLDGEET